MKQVTLTYKLSFESTSDNEMHYTIMKTDNAIALAAASCGVTFVRDSTEETNDESQV